MPGLDYRELRRRIPMRRVLTLLGYRPTRRRGDQWRGPCPFCPPRTTFVRSAPFSIHILRGVFYCHRCQSSGNQLDLWQFTTTLPFHAACLDLCDRTDTPPPWLAS